MKFGKSLILLIGTLFDISSTEKDAAKEPKNKEILLLNFNFNNKDIMDNNESPAPTLSITFDANAGELKYLFLISQGCR